MEKKIIAQLSQIADAIRGLKQEAASPALIVEGALEMDAKRSLFVPEQSAASYEEAKAFIAGGKGVVYLSFGGTMEMITVVAADGMSSANATWLEK